MRRNRRRPFRGWAQQNVTGAAFALLLLFARCEATPSPAAGTGSATIPAGSGFYVSPRGDDDNPGTLAAPFATLGRAQRAMESSSIKSAYVERGTYRLSSAINLTAADSGETWQYYAPDGMDTAVLDGGNSTEVGFSIKGAPNVMINGLKMRHFTKWTIEAYSSPGTVIENNDIGFMTVTPAAGNAGSSQGITVGDHVTVRHNYLHDLASIAIGAFAYDAGQSVDGTLISGNAVVRAVQQSSDDGAIYVNMKGTGERGGHVTIANNFVSDVGGTGFTSLRDLYLDDNASNVSVTGNVLGPPAARVASRGGNFNAVFVHNGSNNTITGNIIDLGNSGFVNIVSYGYDSDSLAGMANNVFTKNIILSKFTGPNRVDSGWGNFAYLEAPRSNAPAAWFTIENNAYWNYAEGGQGFFNGNLRPDKNPVIVNPGISGAGYAIAGDSPVFGSVNFPAIVGGWGPPGLVLQDTGNRSPP